VAEPILIQSTRLQSDDLLAIIKDFDPRYAAAIGRRGSVDSAPDRIEASTDVAVATPAPVPVQEEAAPSAPVAPCEDETARAAPIPAAVNRNPVPLGDHFLSAGSAERRLLLANLEDGTLTPAEQAFAADTADAVRELETAALGRRPEDFIRGLERALRIAADRARAIVHDDTGEPLLVAVKALGMPSDTLLRVLLFLNPVIGHSVERVFDLINLYDRLSAEAAHHLVASWRHPQRRETARYQPLAFDDEQKRARTFADHRSFPMQVPDGRTRVPAVRSGRA
jgi:hypothetical protein